MTPSELKAKTSSDLKVQMNELQEELFKLRLQKQVGQLEKTHRLKELRREIARTLTALTEKAEEVLKK